MPRAHHAIAEKIARIVPATLSHSRAANASPTGGRAIQEPSRERHGVDQLLDRRGPRDLGEAPRWRARTPRRAASRRCQSARRARRARTDRSPAGSPDAFVPPLPRQGSEAEIDAVARRERVDEHDARRAHLGRDARRVARAGQAAVYVHRHHIRGARGPGALASGEQLARRRSRRRDRRTTGGSSSRSAAPISSPSSRGTSSMTTTTSAASRSRTTSGRWTPESRSRRVDVNGARTWTRPRVFHLPRIAAPVQDSTTTLSRSRRSHSRDSSTWFCRT